MKSSSRNQKGILRLKGYLTVKCTHKSYARQMANLIVNKDNLVLDELSILDQEQNESVVALDRIESVEWGHVEPMNSSNRFRIEVTMLFSVHLPHKLAFQIGHSPVTFSHSRSRLFSICSQSESESELGTLPLTLPTRMYPIILDADPNVFLYKNAQDPAFQMQAN